MVRCVPATTFALLSILGFTTAASADTLRCQSVNGNVNCAGSDGVACQTIDGRKTCVSGHGDVIQSFGKGTSSNAPNQDLDDGTATDGDMDETSSSRGPHKPQAQHAPGATR